MQADFAKTFTDSRIGQVIVMLRNDKSGEDEIEFIAQLNGKETRSIVFSGFFQQSAHSIFQDIGQENVKAFVDSLLSNFNEVKPYQS